MSTSETLYCYHCGRQHPREEMRQIPTKAGKKWRCIRSIEATKRDVAARNAFGKEVTAINKSESQTRMKARMTAERLLDGR